MRIEELIVDLSKDPFNPELNFRVAVKYEDLKQAASAITFYLRTAEYGVDTHNDLAYASLLKMAVCFSNQNNREHTVLNCWRQALIVNPDRPEAYFIMAQYYEQKAEWHEAYTWAVMGLSKVEQTPLPVDVGYPGNFALEFEKAVAGWWIGRLEESKAIFSKLLTMDIPSNYVEAIIDNFKRINPS
jgi:tetratricopeptide (TPR) repeat protein